MKGEKKIGVAPHPLPPPRIQLSCGTSEVNSVNNDSKTMTINQVIQYDWLALLVKPELEKKHEDKFVLLLGHRR